MKDAMPVALIVSTLAIVFSFAVDEYLSLPQVAEDSTGKCVYVLEEAKDGSTRRRGCENLPQRYTTFYTGETK